MTRRDFEDALYNPPYNQRAVDIRTRKTIAILCVAVVVFTGFLPGVSANLPPVILTSLWLIVPAVVAVTMRRRAMRCDQQSVALLSLVLSRAPPFQPTLA